MLASELSKGDRFVCTRALYLGHGFQVHEGDVVAYDRPCSSTTTWLQLLTPTWGGSHYVAIPDDEFRDHFTFAPLEENTND